MNKSEGRLDVGSVEKQQKKRMEEEQKIEKFLRDTPEHNIEI